ncbi:hypothetical protein OAM96_04130 [Candidatus Poseidoniaceae archaeon]|nr:hypothetical protein [Candidatus Poseidoniaceae archaeon]|tara:strand:+ start:969 stop:1628 length:660 start_codon:yes stop_codon:yes gene_type:complete
MDITGDFWQQIDGWASPALGGFLIAIAIFLLLSGSKNIKAFSFFIGCAIGMLSSSILYDALGTTLAISAGDFTLIATIGCGILSLLFISLVSLAVTLYISLNVMFGIISMLESNGYDLELGVTGGLLFFISWFMNRFLKKNLYVFGSAALGALMAIYGFSVFTGQTPSQVDLDNLVLQFGGLVLFINSVLYQRYRLKEAEKTEEDEELRTVPKYLEKNN